MLLLEMLGMFCPSMQFMIIIHIIVEIVFSLLNYLIDIWTFIHGIPGNIYNLKRTLSLLKLACLSIECNNGIQ